VHHSHRRFIAALGAGQIRSWGSLYYSFPLIAESMRTGLSKPDFYGAATIKLLLSGLAAYPLGSAIDRGRGDVIRDADRRPWSPSGLVVQRSASASEPGRSHAE
jgi:hypothetical protein